jgi:23S rRNA (adenine2503-C2)-methyltransferase
LHGLLCHVNLIPLNPTPGTPLQPSPAAQVVAFRDLLVDAGLPTTVRLGRGISIEAGCGQLRQRQAGIAGLGPSQGSGRSNHAREGLPDPEP